jgi:hypothetical protein
MSNNNNNNEDTELGRHIVRKDNVEYSIAGLPEGRKSPGTSVINIVKGDRRSSQAIRDDMEAKYQSLVQMCMESLGKGENAGAILSKIEDDLSPQAMIQIVNEARRRLAAQQTEEQERDEIEKHRRFRERLQQYKDRCPDCGTDLGWEPGALENRHRPTCTKYLDRIRREGEQRDRKLAIINQFDKIQRAIDSLSSDCKTLRESLSNFKFIDASAEKDSKDNGVTKDALDKIREEINSASDYEKGKRKWKTANLRALADSLDAYYQWFERPTTK